MDSLTKIIEKIEAENKAACEAVLADAKVKAAEILAEAEAAAAAVCERQLNNAAKQQKAELAKADSAAELAYKRRLLAARVEIIDRTIGKAASELTALPEEEYFDTLLSLVVRYAEAGEAVLCLSDGDFARCPKDFADRVHQALGGKTRVQITGGAELKQGGCLLRYAETVINCGFDALLDDVRDEVKDSLNKILFD